ncbi:unnamed protein product [Rotaria sp. Silwood2]|nr:unnamed protein product [Rotaria sp. Silwood2]CAF2497843.1 unnamed protein product [Rotaria sp. Silwood2]CAF2812897.1 unnamed protein product [Rotaria sp. Silwood2]CAF2895128.1 unnamed protein product [Rotaria sp. Silwood2]CAF3925528.1 unnamed protein product [Rotaria sp. Silwood2]
MCIQKLFPRLLLSNIMMKRKLMTKQERSISEIIALHDQNLESIINKSDYAKNLLLQSLFDRQIQEYIHLNYDIPIEIYDKYMYRLNSLIIHNPNDFDKYKNLLDGNRFISEMEYKRFLSFFSNFVYSK